MTVVHRCALVAAVAVAVALGAAPAARAGWSAARTVHGAGTVRTAPALASNQRDDVLVAWIDERGVMVASAHRGGRLSRPRRLPGDLASVRHPIALQAAIDETGTAAVAWDDCRPIEPGPSPACGGEVRVAVRRPGRGFSSARRVSGAGKITSLGEVVVRSGLAVVTFAQRRKGTRAATFVAHSAGNGFERQKIARFSRFPGVVRARDGSERFLYVTDTGVRAVTRAASGRLGRSRQVVRANVRPYLDAGGASGQQALVWRDFDTGAVREGLLLPGRPMAARTLDRGPGYRRVAIDGAANGQFVTLYANERTLRGISYSRRVPGSRSFAAPRDLPKAGFGRGLDVSVRPDGVAAVAWNEPSSERVRVGILGADGRMRASSSFAVAPGGQIVMTETSIDRDGRAWLVWLDGVRLRVARYAR